MPWANDIAHFSSAVFRLIRWKRNNLRNEERNIFFPLKTACVFTFSVFNYVPVPNNMHTPKKTLFNVDTYYEKKIESKSDSMLWIESGEISQPMTK